MQIYIIYPKAHTLFKKSHDIFCFVANDAVKIYNL